jgi:hypothetical protein
MKYDYPLYLTYEERTYGGSPINPEDSWPDYEDAHVEFYPRGLFKNREVAGLFPQGLMKDEVHGEFNAGDPAFMLVVRYETGNTFGRTLGYWHIEGVYQSRDFAEAIKKSIEDDTYDVKYKPWIGYFERLENVEIYPMVVE